MPPASIRTSAAVPPALAISGVSHFYGRRQALDDVSFSIAPASFTVLTVTREQADGNQASSGERVLLGPVRTG